MKLKDIPAKVHFVGIGGIGMSALAQYLHTLGYVVTGSDRASNDQTRLLASSGIRVYIGHNKYNVRGAELVVHTSAVHRDNIELIEAKKSGIPIVLREQILGAVFNSFKTRIAVCGTHGKTTVTAMIHELLTESNVSHAAFIGGLYHGNNFYFGQDVAVAEACEYNRSFFNLKPTVTVCTNAEYDHPDCYKNVAAVKRAFKRFMAFTDKDGTVILPQNLEELAPRGTKKIIFDKALVSDIQMRQGKPCFTAQFGKKSMYVKLNVVGKHNVYNALAAMAVGAALRLPAEKVVAALQKFDGVERRWSGFNCGFDCVCDYAHHPTEIACSVSAAKSIARGKVICVFQPHTYSRTKAFFKQFATCFMQADAVAYLPVYSAREKPQRNINSQRLAKCASKKGINAMYFADFKTAARWLRQNAQKDDLVLILGAGNVVELADLLRL